MLENDITKAFKRHLDCFRITKKETVEMIFDETTHLFGLNCVKNFGGKINVIMLNDVVFLEEPDFYISKLNKFLAEEKLIDIHLEICIKFWGLYKNG